MNTFGFTVTLDQQRHVCKTIPAEDELKQLMSNHKHGMFIADDKSEAICTNKFFHDFLTCKCAVESTLREVVPAKFSHYAE